MFVKRKRGSCRRRTDHIVGQLLQWWLADQLRVDRQPDTVKWLDNDNECWFASADDRGYDDLQRDAE